MSESEAEQPHPSLQTNPVPSKAWRSSIVFGDFGSIAAADSPSKAPVADASNEQASSDPKVKQSIKNPPLAIHIPITPVKPQPESLHLRTADFRPSTPPRTSSAPNVIYPGEPRAFRRPSSQPPPSPAFAKMRPAQQDMVPVPEPSFNGEHERSGAEIPTEDGNKSEVEVEGNENENGCQHAISPALSFPTQVTLKSGREELAETARHLDEAARACGKFERDQLRLNQHLWTLGHELRGQGHSLHHVGDNFAYSCRKPNTHDVEFENLVLLLKARNPGMADIAKKLRELALVGEEFINNVDRIFGVSTTPAHIEREPWGLRKDIQEVVSMWEHVALQFSVPTRVPRDYTGARTDEQPEDQAQPVENRVQDRSGSGEQHESSRLEPQQSEAGPLGTQQSDNNQAIKHEIGGYNPGAETGKPDIEFPLMAVMNAALGSALANTPVRIIERRKYVTSKPTGGQPSTGPEQPESLSESVASHKHQGKGKEAAGRNRKKG